MEPETPTSSCDNETLSDKLVGFELEFVRPEGAPGEEALFDIVRASLSDPMSAAQGFCDDLSIVSECSIDDGVGDRLSRGFEIVTPPWPGPLAAERLQLLLAWAGQEGLVCNRTTGIHFNLSFADPGKTLAIPHPAIGVCLDEEGVLRAFGRSGNPDCQPMSALETPSGFARPGDSSEAAMKALLADVAEENSGAEKTLGVVEKFSEGLRYFEFRHAGGEGYAEKTLDLHRALVAFSKALDLSLCQAFLPGQGPAPNDLAEGEGGFVFSCSAFARLCEGPLPDIEPFAGKPHAPRR